MNNLKQKEKEEDKTKKISIFGQSQGTIMFIINSLIV